MKLLQFLPHSLPGITASARAKAAIPNRLAPLPLLAAALVVLTLAAASLVIPGPAAAEEITLVANSNQGNRTLEEEVGPADVYQEFTTGPNPAGYRLTRVGIRIGDGTSTATLLLSVRRGGTTIANLAGPSPWVTGINYATAPSNTNLDPNTTYTLRAKVVSSGVFAYRFYTTTNNGNGAEQVL